MKKTLNNKWLNWTLAIGWMIFIFYLSSVSRFPVQFQDPFSTYISYGAHVFLYMSLTFLFLRAAHVSGMPLKKVLIIGFLIAIIYGATDEVHQYFVPYRQMDIKDWLVDGASALVVVYLYNRFHKSKIAQSK